MRQLAYWTFGVAATVVAVLVILWITDDIQAFVNRPDLAPSSLDAYAAAGDYFNAFYGLPLALVGAVLVALATFIAGLYAARQDDVKILEFTEEKVTPAIRLFQSLVRNIGDILVRGNEVRTIGRELYWRIEEEGGPNTSQLAALLLAAPDVDDPEGAIEYIEQALAREGVPLDVYRELLAGSFLHLLQLRACLRELCGTFDVLSADIYGNLFARRRIERAGADGPLSWLKAQLPATFTGRGGVLDASYYLEQSPLDVAQHISRAAQDATLFAPAQAAALIADRAYTIEYLGMVLRCVFLTPRRPVALPSESGEITLYMINLGAAYLLWTAMLTPDKDTVIDVFKSIFPNRRHVAVRVLEAALPERRNLGPTYVLDSIEPCLRDFSRLLMVQIRRGSDTSTEFYAPGRHGPTPVAAYPEPKDEPLQEAV